MIRALAEFVMRGRLQASSVAMLGNIIPLLTPVIVALVTLRRGAFEGALILSLSLIPVLLSIMLQESGSALLWITLISLIVVFIPALILRISISLPLAVVVSIAVPVLISGFTLMTAGAQLDELIAVLQKGLVAQEASQPLPEVEISHAAITGILAYILAAHAISGLLIGRWMQAMLYNPGGFGEEFRNFRLSATTAILCFAASLALFMQGAEYWWWSSTLALPLMLVAIAVTHSAVNSKSLTSFWLVLCYMAVFFVGPLVVIIGLLDTWLNFRSRLQKK